MKIAVYYNLAYGGAKRVVQEHVKGLRKLGHEIDIYTHDKNKDMFSPGPFANHEYEYEYTINTIHIPVVSRFLSDFQVFFKLKNLHKKIAHDIDGRKYNIVLVHTDTYTQAPFILKFLRTKSLYFCLEPLRMVYEYSLKIPETLGLLNKFYESINRVIRKRIDRDNARKATYTTSISLFGREYMIHAFNLYPKISYIGVDKDIFRPLDRKKKNQILFVAEKEYIYGYDFAKAALKLIPEKIRPTLKIIFGTKKDQRIQDKELVKAYNDSLVTLSLSKFDTFGLVPLESMACSTPVIAFNVAGYRETIIDGRTGYLVDFDVKEIAEKIIFFIKNPLLSTKMGKEGRRWIEDKWTWNIQIKKLDKLLQQFSEKTNT